MSQGQLDEILERTFTSGSYQLEPADRESGSRGELLNQERIPTKFLSGDMTRKGVSIPWLIFMTDK